jgi:hypothetical protein
MHPGLIFKQTKPKKAKKVLPWQKQPQQESINPENTEISQGSFLTGTAGQERKRRAWSVWIKST